jgi:molecular chaperone GrpE
MEKHKEHNKHHQKEKTDPGGVENSKENHDIADDVLERKIEDEKASEELRKGEQRKSPRRESDCAAEELEKKLIEENTKLKEELTTLKDTMMRRQADFENYKKRLFKQQAETRSMAIRDFAHDVILINDDLLRAIEASEQITKHGSIEESHKSFLEGVMMISKQIEETLKKYNVIEIDSLNREFDPNIHEAIEIEQHGDEDCDMVTKVYHKGFRLDDLVVRSAKVKVTKPKPKRDQESMSVPDDKNKKDEAANREDKKGDQ